ncbi:RNA polymerase sigma factor [Puia sp. P3]|uniref:RNA polymerase sigma factor n=1 Tax=Puia sp. P3 TaxID=3423952 RepID=UPI003D677BEF
MREGGKYTETELLTGFRQGRDESFTQVFKALCPVLCGYSARLTRDWPAAEDIVQEAFVKIWERRTQFYQFVVLKSYLYTTVRNDSLQWLRRENRKQAKDLSSQQEEPDNQRSKLEDLIRAEVIRELSAVVETLPPQCRQVISLFIEGKNTREVAQTMQISQGNVKVQKGRGLKLLRKQLPDFLTFGFTLFMYHCYR